MIEEIKELRERIDALKEPTNQTLGGGGPVLANYAKAWLGKVLDTLGEKNPYGQEYKDVSEIVATQQVAKSPFVLEGETDLEKYQSLRKEVEGIITILEDRHKYSFGLRQLYLGNALTELGKIKFNLGFKIGDLRDAAKKEGSK